MDGNDTFDLAITIGLALSVLAGSIGFVRLIVLGA